ncbi:MAG: histidine phosphatase family protein [Pontiellaceae bacterium]|nr:histidine phosphatase family protein [Pontiellaceae bacterium]
MANVEGIIVSDPGVGTQRYGLSETGRVQVQMSAEKLAALIDDAVIVSSDFLRAVETAELVRFALGVDSIRLDARLRERFFGQWEGMHYLNYSAAWEEDEMNAELEVNGAESANAVRRRMEDVIASLEIEFSERNVVLVSHGDPLRLMQAAFCGLSMEQNRMIPYFETAEFRRLNP